MRRGDLKHLQTLEKQQCTIAKHPPWIIPSINADIEKYKMAPKAVERRSFYWLEKVGLKVTLTQP